MPEAVVVDYEMGYGADEFGKVLQGSFSSEQSGLRCNEIKRHHWQITRPGTDLDLNILVAEQPPRQLGLFKLPVLAVTFTFEVSDEGLREDFFHRFHQYFHKGGG